MVKLLLKKQLFEIFRAYFYDAKKNKKRSKGGTIAFFILYVFIMIGLLGGIFGYVAFDLSYPLYMANMGWLYFVLMGGISIFLGAFGSVFNTFSCLYLAKDNDLLLSMPIPIKDIMLSRLFTVYILGAMYSVVVTIPTLVIYWIKCQTSPMIVIGGIVYMIMITLFVLVLSCLLGWAVARLSLKLKHKSIVTVLLSLVFIGLYYFVYFKATELIRDIVDNAAIYGNKVKGASHLLYAFGQMGTGDALGILEISAIVIALCILTYYLLKRSFLKIATSSAVVAKVTYKKKIAKQRGLFATVLSKEFGRFLSSSNYMLNCGLGVVFLPILGISMIWKGQDMMDLFIIMTGNKATGFVLLATAVAVMSAMNDSAAPSVSLEGKNLWIVQSLPITTKMILLAKFMVQFLISVIPALFATICIAFVWKGSIAETLLLLLISVGFTFFYASFDLFFGIMLPNLNWTNETSPIKQSLSVFIALFGGWIYAAIWPILYFIAEINLTPIAFVWVETLTSIFVGGIFFTLNMTKGVKKFDSLS